MVVLKQETETAPVETDKNVRPVTIMGHVYGAFPSFAMLAAMKLDVFTPLEGGPMKAGDLAESLGVREDKLVPLLYSLVAADLLKMEGNHFFNSLEASKYLVRGRPDYMGGLSGFYGGLWHAAMQSAESIRTGKPQAKLDWAALPENALLNYFHNQFHNCLRAGKELAQKLDLAKFEHLLDAGGGTGGIAISLCEQFASLKATVADLPKVVRVSERFIAEAGMSDRIRVLPVDLCMTSPEGVFDVAVLRALLQTISREQAEATLRHIGQSMEPGGKLFIVGTVLENSFLSPPASLAFGLVFLNVYEEGCSYTEKEYAEMLGSAGFNNISLQYDALDDGYALITAEKAAS